MRRESNCYGCTDRGSSTQHDVTFTDSRTGRSFCHGCVAALVTWELDEEPEPDEYPYREWIGAS